MAPIRVGIVGANPERGWALTAHLPGLTELPEFELAAVATTRDESAKATAERFGFARSYGDPAALFADAGVDAVVVCVKVPYHHELVKAALEAGKHVFCEWPLGANTEQAVELQSLAASRGLVGVVGLQGRMSPLVNYVHDLVSDGYVGRVLTASLSVEGGARGGAEIPADRVWAMDKANGATTLTITGGHEIDVMCCCIGDLGELDAVVATRNPSARVVETGATIEVSAPDVVLAQGSLAAGGYFTVAIQSGIPNSTGAKLSIQGTDGSLVVSGTGGFHLSDAPLTLTATRNGTVEPLIVPDTYETVPESIPEGPARNVAGLYQAFATAIGGGPLDAPDFGAAVELHRLLGAMEEASTTGSRQQVPA